LPVSTYPLTQGQFGNNWILNAKLRLGQDKHEAEFEQVKHSDLHF
jgi:hypothetical protein